MADDSRQCGVHAKQSMEFTQMVQKNSKQQSGKQKWLNKGNDKRSDR